MLKSLIQNHVLANSTFVVILIIGSLIYTQMPRSKDPEVNFNWLNVTTALPGASTEDVEKLITNPLENAIRQVSDVKFVKSESREGISSITVRFEELSERNFDKRLNDFRREIQNKSNQELPEEAKEPAILEITTSNSFPTAMIAIKGAADDEILRKYSALIKQDIESIKGVDGIRPAGLHSPEIQIDFDPDKLLAYGIRPTELSQTINSHFRDVAAGTANIGNKEWLIRLVGTDNDPERIGQFPINTAQGIIPVSSVAEISRGRKKPEKLALYKGKPSVLLAITKKPMTNTLDLVDRINNYVEAKNPLLTVHGLEIIVIDDQTLPTRTALDIMQTNAALGLLLVILITWLFLGGHIAMFIGIGIPFTLAATFWILSATGSTLNQSVLLGIVIVLGMLVDDAVVVVEAIYYRIERGAKALDASLNSLAEVFKPVSASVMTTIAAFLPLMLLPGIVGDFMFVIPFVVTVALAVSLIEAYWMLPVHITAANVKFSEKKISQQFRKKLTQKVRLKYSKMLIKVLRRPKIALITVILLFASSIGLILTDQIRVKFFAFDPLQIFYINIIMEPGTELEETLGFVHSIEKKVNKLVTDEELRETVSIAGQMFTQQAPHFGPRYGQVTVSLNPKSDNGRGVIEIVDDMRKEVLSTPGASNIAFLVLSGGPPAAMPISVKVRGNNFDELEKAAEGLKEILYSHEAILDITDDNSPGKPELQLKLDTAAVKRAGLNPGDVARIVRLMFDGEIVTSMQDKGEKVEVRVRATPKHLTDINEILRQVIALPNGGQITIGQLATFKTAPSRAITRHYDYRRTITVEADLNKDIMDTVAANDFIKEEWQKIQIHHPNVNLNFTGELDDIEESLGAMGILFIFGIGLIYLILGAQFKSYFQPFMILATVPMAFTGVAYGLAVTGNPLSMFTMYGVVALAGISVNAAIVMIDAANNRLNSGMSVLHATVYAARRRVIPILITSLTTIAGLFSLASGLGGHSLIWGPVAASIVWGLAFSTILTLFVIPLLYRTFMKPILKSTQ